jgi:hypothetical protein
MCPSDAASGYVIKIYEALTIEKTGAFWHFDGTTRLGKWLVCCMSIWALDISCMYMMLIIFVNFVGIEM